MIRVENVETAGWEPALRGMRNPLESWDRADSEFDVWREVEVEAETGLKEGWREPVRLGPNDESLMRCLIGQGSADHCKFRRMLAIYCDVTAPLYWWKEFSTYRVGTVMNSCSTMHTLMRRPFEVGMFSHEDWAEDHESRECGTTYSPVPQAAVLVNYLNETRDRYIEARDRGYDERARHLWRRIVQLLPESWMQRRTLMLNYEVMASIYRARRHHKLREWRDFIGSMVEGLPYPWIFTGEGC